MTTHTAGDTELVPIDEVARRLGIRASAMRYYEERGLVEPLSRQSGRRWYGPSEIRRLAIILYWQKYALMSLDEIGEILAGAGSTRGWAEIVQSRIDVLGEQIAHMEAAREFLVHVASKHDDSPDGCPHFESQIWERLQPR
jgi:MerR family transcriptional regulator, copper efflux regulator